MAKYTKEEKQKAIDLYIRYCRQATKVIKELGYPNERHTLVNWYRGYEEKGEVKDDGREAKKLRTRDVMINTLDVRRGSGKNLTGRSQQGLYALLSYDRWESL